MCHEELEHKGYKSKERRTKSKEQALSALMALAARAERSSGDAYRLMKSWGVEESDYEWVMERLYKERFIDDERYARAYMREKLSLNGWGKFKIINGLRAKGVSREVIEGAMSEMDKSRFEERLRELLQRKARSVRYENIYQLRDKLLRHGASRGYGFEMLQGAIDDICKELDNG